jgi:hypothetical protein
MAVSVLTLSRASGNSTKINHVVASSSENYATGGITCTANQLGLSRVQAAFVAALPLAGGAYVGNYNVATGKISLYWVNTTVNGAALAEIPNATAIGATVYNIIAFGV